MVGWHILIGLGEGLITALVVIAVVRSRPDLVHAIADEPTTRDLQIREVTR